MLEQKISRTDLALTLGIKITTLGNIIRGARCSAETKEKIHVALRTKIWRRIPAPAFFEPGAALVFSHLTMAREFLRFVSGCAILRGRTAEFIKPCTLMLQRESEVRNEETKAQEIDRSLPLALSDQPQQPKGRIIRAMNDR